MERSIKRWSGYSFETFLGFDGDKVPDIDLNFSGDDQPSAHLDVRDIFGEQYAFSCWNSRYCCRSTAYGFVKVTNVTTISFTEMPRSTV